MGKASMCIRMLQLLNTGKIYKVSELAGLLDTNPRNIIEYKKELDEISVESGFYIETIPGRYGGYKLNGNALIPATKLTGDEKRILIESYKYLLSKSDFIDKQDAMFVYSKIMSNLLIEEKNLELVAVNKVLTSEKILEIKKWYQIIETAIAKKKALIIRYDFLKEPEHEVKVHPYNLFIYDNEWRFFGWNVEVGDIFYFKLSRIKDIKMTDESFRVWKSFKMENYLKDGVFTQSGEMFKITLIATGIRAKLFKEKKYGKNQVYEDLPDGSTKITLEMQKNPSTYNFLLGCGDGITILEPAWLIDKIKDIVKNISSKY